MPLLFLVCGLGLLYFGAEGLVRGASSLALRLGLSPLVVGLTIVAFGTSAPELVVSLKSNLASNGDLALGNVVGSNICNIGLILGLSAVIRPLRIEIDVVRHQVPIMILASAILLVMLSDGLISRLEGGLLISGFLVYVSFNLLRSRKEKHIPAGVLPGHPTRLGISSAFVIAGLALLILGAEVFVRGAVETARWLHFSEAVIGLTIVAFGTSLPELATSVVAAFKGEADIATGNVIGSNIFNILAILGTTALARPLAAGGISWITLVIMGITVILVLPLFRSGFILSRIEGGIFLVIYAGYIVWLATAGAT